jgi:hypothetical protein
MAKSRSRATASRRQTKATSRKAKEPKKAKEKAQSAEIVEEGRGLGIDDGVVIATTLLFLAALVMIDRELGVHYGAGLLFK